MIIYGIIANYFKKKHNEFINGTIIHGYFFGFRVPTFESTQVCSSHRTLAPSTCTGRGKNPTMGKQRIPTVKKRVEEAFPKHELPSEGER